jgi:hypothetical protein
MERLGKFKLTDFFNDLLNFTANKIEERKKASAANFSI